MDGFVKIDGVAYQVGDFVVVDVDGTERVGEIDAVFEATQEVSLNTGGIFTNTGEMNIGMWWIRRKATPEEVATFPEY